MRITNIHGSALKGSTFDHAIEPVCIITGPNEAGKTSRADAVRMTLLGYDPASGKSGKATFDGCASGPVMRVGLTFTGDLMANRSWASAGASVKVVEKIPHQLDGAFPALLFDAGEFFALTAKERAAKLMALCAGKAEFNITDVTAELKNMRFEPQTANHETAVNETCDWLNDLDDTHRNTPSPLPVPEFLTMILTELREKQKAADAVVKAMRGRNLGDAMLAQGMPVIRQGIDAELAVVRRDRSLKVAELATVEAELSGLDNAAVRYQQSAALLERKPDVDFELRAIATAENQLGNYPDVTDELTATRAVYEKALESFQQLDRTPKHPTALRRRLEVAGQLQYIENQWRRATENLERVNTELATATTGDCCPECGAKNKKWKDKRVAKYQPEVDKWEGEVNRLFASMKRLKGDYEFAALAETQTDQHDQHITIQSSHLDSLLEQRRVAEKRQTDHNNVNRSLEFLKDKLASKIAACKAAHAEAKAAMDAGMPPGDRTAMKQHVIELGADIARLDLRIVTLETEQRQSVAARSEAQRRERAKEELAIQEATVEVLKACGKIVLAKQSAILDGSIGAFMRKSGHIVNEVLGKALEYRDGEIGYWRESKWVSHTSFCRAESLLAYTGFSLALATDAPVRVVIMDELGRLDRQRKAALLTAVQDMIQRCELDNFIGIDADGRDWNNSGVQIIQL